MVEKIIIEGRYIALNAARALDASHNISHNIMWLPGYLSDMEGTKASFLSEFCAQEKLGFIRFDYSGVGLSVQPAALGAQPAALGAQPAQGQAPAPEQGLLGPREQGFLQATLSDWLAEILHIYKKYNNKQNNNKPVVLVGSSCGGWLALLAALELQKQGCAPAALLLLAPAPDFTSKLLLNKFSDQQRAELASQGYIYWSEEAGGEGAAGEPLPFSQKFIDDAKQHHLLAGLIDILCPVYIMQGQKDQVVPPEHSQALLHRLARCDVSYNLVKDGDHRLSRPQDLAKLAQILRAIVADC